MKIVDRLLVVLVSLGTIVSAAVIVLLVAGWEMPLWYLEAGLWSPGVRIGTGLGGAVLLVIGLVVLARQFSPPPVTRALIQTTSLGDVKISVEGLENLVSRACYQIRGIREAKVRVDVFPGSIGVFVRAIVGEEVNIPEVTKELQERVKNYVEQVSGIVISEVRVLVDNVGPTVRPSRVE